MRHIDQFRKDHPKPQRAPRGPPIKQPRKYFRDYQRARRKTPAGRLEIARTNLKALHGIDLQHYETLYEKQRGMCAICRKQIERGFTGEDLAGKRGPRKNGAQIDHDHACCPGRKSCGKCFRGLLCGDCNTGLGCFRDSAALLMLAIEYLRGAAQR